MAESAFENVTAKKKIYLTSYILNGIIIDMFVRAALQRTQTHKLK